MLSVEGTMTGVILGTEGTSYFMLKESSSGTIIQCGFSNLMLYHVRAKLGEKIVVRGSVYFDSKGIGEKMYMTNLAHWQDPKLSKDMKDITVVGQERRTKQREFEPNLDAFEGIR